MKTFAQQAKSIQNKYKNRKDKLSMDSMHRELAALEQQQEMLRESMNLVDNQQSFAQGGFLNHPDDNMLAFGGRGRTMLYAGPGQYPNIIPNQETIDKWNTLYPDPASISGGMGEFQMPYDQMVSQYGNPDEQTPVTTQPPFKPGYTEQPAKKPFNYNDLIGYSLQGIGPALDMYYGLTKKDAVNYDRVTPQKINLAPKTMAELMIKSASPAYWLAKNQSLGQGSLLNTLGTISGNVADKTGEAYLNAKLKQEAGNADYAQQANVFNAQTQREESIDRLKEKDSRRSAVRKGAGDLGTLGAMTITDKYKNANQDATTKMLKNLLAINYPNFKLPA